MHLPEHLTIQLYGVFEQRCYCLEFIIARRSVPTVEQSPFVENKLSSLNIGVLLWRRTGSALSHAFILTSA